MSKSKKAEVDQRTLVTFLLDETGSMQSIKDDTIGGFNSYLASLKAESAPIDFTLIKFDSRRIEKVCVCRSGRSSQRTRCRQLSTWRLDAPHRCGLQGYQGRRKIP
jgi:hypothetical protein